MEKALAEQIGMLKPVPFEPTDVAEYKEVTLERAERDNSKWLAYITEALDGAKTFEIHCWNEEAEWIELALQYGKIPAYLF